MKFYKKQLTVTYPNINNFKTSDIMEQNENNMQEAAGKEPVQLTLNF